MSKGKAGEHRYSVADVCSIFGVNRSTVLNWLREGTIEKFDIECFVPYSAIAKFAKKHHRKVNLAKVDQSAFRKLVFSEIRSRRGRR